MLQYQFRPIEQWPEKPLTPKPSPFRAGYTDTLQALESELKHLQARDIVIQAYVRAEDLRLDGMLRSGARPSKPGVILSFESKHGPLSYPCDRYSDWQANLRAIALSLEALRSVDRYGVTKRAEQYQGWAKLPPPATNVRPSLDAATVEVLAAAKSVAALNAETFPEIRRAALRNAHPDMGGSPDVFKRVRAAVEVLDAQFGT